jgi:putative NADH-flavin reductase
VRILVVGASGATGSQVIRAGLRRGHQVTAMVRDPAGLPFDKAGPTIFIGDPLDPARLSAAASGQEAIITALGHRRGSPLDLLESSAQNLVAAMARVGTRRVLAVSVALLFTGNWPLGPFLRLILRDVKRDSQAMEEVFRASDLDWTIARPPRLLSGKPKGHYRAHDERLPPWGTSVDRADLADFLLDEAEQARHVRHVVGVSG